MGMVSTLELNRRQAVIYVDGVVFLRLKRSDFDLAPVCEGDELDEEAYIDRVSALQSKRAYDAALDLLSQRDMTNEGVKRALLRKGFMEPVADAVCQRLQENRLIDDQRFARRYVELNTGAEMGRYALERKLRAKGIDRDTAREALEELDEDSQREAALSLAGRLARRYGGDDPRSAKAKLSQALARRGFSWDVIASVMERMGMDDDAD